MINQHRTRLGYDIASLTSIGLLAAVGPRAYHTAEAFSVSLASLAGVSLVGNALKSYQARTGRPHEAESNIKST